VGRLPGDEFRCPDNLDEYAGFALPDEEPDGRWHLPKSEAYPTGEITFSFWLRGNEVLAESSSCDPVMFLNHFRW
jgi:hypothetical protein